MKIAFVLGDLSSIGGIERVTSILSDVFVRHGHDVAIVSLFKEHETLNYHFNPAVRIEYLTHKKYATKKPGGISRLLMFFSILFLFRKSYKKTDYDLFIGQGFPNSWILWMSGLAVKSVACEHVCYGRYGVVLRFIRNIIYKSFFRVVVLTDNDHASFSKVISNAIVIPNPVCTDSSRQSDLSSKNIISVGRLSAEKGYDLLLNICPAIFSKFPDWELHIYGEGPLHDKLLQLRDELMLQDKVYFEGITSHIEQAYCDSSVYVMSSLYEGFGMVLVEAAACGLPIVSFDCPNGPRDILQNDHGILVPVGDEMALQNALMAMLENEDMRKYYAKKALEIPSQYTPEHIYKLWENSVFKQS